jgi:Beta-galactosidase trimerisation domain.
METHWQFDVIDRYADFNRYRALVVPDRFVPDPQTARKLRAYLQKGGKLLFSHRAFVDAQGNFALADLAGFNLKGESGWDCEYLLVSKALADGVPDMSHVVNAPSMVVELRNAKPMATIGEPYFNRTWRISLPTDIHQWRRRHADPLLFKVRTVASFTSLTRSFGSTPNTATLSIANLSLTLCVCSCRPID